MLTVDSNKKIIYICNKYFYKYLIEYIDALLSHIPNSELLIYQAGNKHMIQEKMRREPNSIYIIFRHPLRAIQYPNVNNIYFFNTEQLTLLNWLKKVKDMPFKIIDYSDSNIKCLNKAGKLSYHMPYQVNYKEIYDYNKIYDVGFIGSISPKRKQIFDKLKNRGINTTIIKGWDKVRDEQLMKHKILINIHRTDALGIFEEIRCNRCIFNKVIVITESSVNFQDYILKDHILECKLDNLVETVVNTLNDYNNVYNKLFGNFDINKIEEKNVELLKKFVDFANKSS